MDTLGKHIERCLKEREFCLVLEDELERCWPTEKIKRAERESQIQAFAKSRGWNASILNSDFGHTRAIILRSPLKGAIIGPNPR
jgi:hypothetical protein